VDIQEDHINPSHFRWNLTTQAGDAGQRNHQGHQNIVAEG
jgi:hypothetical protein